MTLSTTTPTLQAMVPAPRCATCGQALPPQRWTTTVERLTPAAEIAQLRQRMAQQRSRRGRK